KRPTVPKFGNWENEANAPYTTYFNEARKGKAAGGKMINPNDPEDNPEMFAAKTQPPPATRPTVPEEHPAPNDNPNKRNSGGPANQRGGGQGAATGRPVRHSVGSDHSFDRSPLHPHHQAKVTGKGGASPAREGKNSYDSTPGRSRMKPARGDDSPDNGAAVPRFGDWDENNPQSGENYTHIFNKVREERVTGSPMVSGSDARPNYNIPRNQKTDNKCCCFPWSK
ncbi:hypothetical protein M8C21_030271, partial [Ambrosia artemisiifolia]